VAILDLVKRTRIVTAASAPAFPPPRFRVYPHVHANAGLVAIQQALSYALRCGTNFEGRVTKLSRAFGELGVNHDHVVRGRTQLRAAVGARFGG
jgi:hypothetical protein